MEQIDLASIINKQHIGLLPMPEYKVWALASPLKRSEYLSSGLLVLGLNHKGHTLEHTESSWFQLIDQHEFHDVAVQWIKSLNDIKFEEGSKNARNYAKRHSSWEHSTNELNSGIQLSIREV